MKRLRIPTMTGAVILRLAKRAEGSLPLALYYSPTEDGITRACARSFAVFAAQDGDIVAARSRALDGARQKIREHFFTAAD